MAGRKIVTQVPTWLTLYDDGFVDRTWTGLPQVTFMTEPVPAHEHFVDGVATRDILIDAGAGLRVRIYLPETAVVAAVPTKLPIVLHFHGGGFCISQPDWYLYYVTYTNLVRTTGAIVVSVYLRRAPEHRLPAPIDDGYSALLWLRDLSQQKSQERWLSAYGDFNRVFLTGESSGGCIVHHVAARAGTQDLSPLRLAGAIPIHPCFVSAERSKSELEMPPTPLITVEMLDKWMELALPEGSTKDHPILYPMGEPMEGLNLPPYLICVAEHDLMIDREMEFYEAMKKAKKDVVLFMSHGMAHAFNLNKIAIDLDPQTSKANQEMLAKITHFIHNH